MPESNCFEEAVRAVGLLAAQDKVIALLGIIECEMIRQRMPKRTPSTDYASAGVSPLGVVRHQWSLPYQQSPSSVNCHDPKAKHTRPPHTVAARTGTCSSLPSTTIPTPASAATA
jgi:hypothetical protein